MRWLLPLFLILTVTLAVSAQDNPPRLLNWEEVKKVQAEERAHMEMSQKQMLEKLMEGQLNEAKLLSSTTPVPNDVKELTLQHSKERLDLARIHSEERSKLATTHADERKAVLQSQSTPKADP